METTKRFSDYIMMVRILRRTVLVMSFLQQRYNLQPIVSDRAEQSIDSDVYAYPQHDC